MSGSENVPPVHGEAPESQKGAGPAEEIRGYESKTSNRWDCDRQGRRTT